MSDHDFLPSDVKGRIACLLIGLFFGAAGLYSLALLIENRRNPLDAVTVYEGSVLAAVFGGVLIVWSLFRPDWVQRFSIMIVGHIFLFIWVLIAPIAVEVAILFIG